VNRPTFAEKCLDQYKMACARREIGLSFIGSHHNVPALAGRLQRLCDQLFAIQVLVRDAGQPELADRIKALREEAEL
jgi:hypothetical protein